MTENLEITRLVLSRYLYDRAESTFDVNDPFSFGLAVSLAQDAVETILSEVGSVVRASIPRHSTFPKMWATIDKADAMTTTLPYAHDMESLNSCRVAFKHHSNLPDEATAQRHLIKAAYFLETVCKDILRVRWADISLADSIQDEEIRGHVKAAENLLATDELEECLEQCSLANHEIQQRFIQFFPQLPSGLMFSGGTPQDQVLEALMQTANSLASEVAYSSLGMNRKDILRFERLIPRAMVSPVSKSVQYVGTRLGDVTIEDVKFCVRHVTRMAIRYENRYEG